eukprot:Opistho-1_new@19050
MASAAKRLAKELQDLHAMDIKTVRNVEVDESDLFNWEVLLVPDTAPYNKGAYKVSMQFLPEYPFKPPKVLFKTKIYHPNVDDSGQVCMALLKQDNWKPATRVHQVLLSLVQLIDEPNPNDPLSTEIADIYVNDKKKFVKNVEEHIKKYAEKRPKE